MKTMNNPYPSLCEYKQALATLSRNGMHYQTETVQDLPGEAFAEERVVWTAEDQ